MPQGAPLYNSNTGPAQSLSIPFYFTSPLNTLLESLYDPDCIQVTFHDIMEAYACFSDRIRLVAKSLVRGEATHAALKIVEEHSAELAQVLKRDLSRAFASSSSYSQHSFNLYSYNTNHGFSNDDAQCALDSAMLAQHALCLISDICILRPLYSLFSTSDFQLIMDDVLAFTIAPELSVLNGPKLCTFIVWILQVQQLPAEVLLAKKDDISLTLTKALRGHFGPRAIMDGLKAIHTLLLRLGTPVLPSMSNLLMLVLNYIVNDSPEVRVKAAYALSGLAYAVASTNQTPEFCRSIRHVTQTFINSHHKKPKDEQRDGSLPKIIEDAMMAIKPTNSGLTPSWALTLISSIIILLDYTLFFHPNCVKLCLSTLLHAARHKRSAVRVLHSHVWKLLIWAYLRIPLSAEEEEMENVDISSIRRRAFKVVAQETKNDIGVAFVASLLQDGQTVVPLAEDIEHSLCIVQNMLQSPDSDTRRNGASLFKRLFRPDEVDLPSEQQKDQLLCQRLFNGSLLNVDINTLSDVVNSIQTFRADSIRRLTNEEIYVNWQPAVSAWVAAARVSLREPESELSNFVLSSWISLLETFVQRCDGLAPTSSPSGLSSSIAMIAGQLLDASDSPDVQIRHLQFAKKVWSVTKSVLYDTWLPSNAEIILAAVLKRNFVLGNDNVRKMWSDLCAELISVGVPTLLHVVYFQSERKEQVEVLRQLWAILARTWRIIDHGITWDDLVTLLVVPFGAWNLSVQEFEQWESMLRNAVKLAEGSPISHNAVIRLFFERLGNNRREAFKASPLALCSMSRQFNISSTDKLECQFFETVDEVLLKFYPPLPESLAACIDLSCIMGEMLSTCPDDLLLGLIKVMQRSLSCWIQDEDRILLETEQNIIVDAVYCNALNRLCYHKLTYDMLHEIVPFLVSVFKAKHIPAPALGPAAFENFWRMTFHGREDLELHCPDEIKMCLTALSLVWGGSLAGSLALGSDSQKSMLFVPDSQSTPHNRGSAARVFLPLSSPFDVFSSPRRHSSALPSSTPDAILVGLVDNIGSQESPTPCSRKDSGCVTPTNQRRFLALGRPTSKSDNTSTSSSRANAEDDGDVFKGRKRLLSPEGDNPRKRRRSNANIYAPLAIQKVFSEPAIESPSSLVVVNRSISQPSPSRKRKLFDYDFVGPPFIRNVRGRHYSDSFPTTPEPWIESTPRQKRPLTGLMDGDEFTEQDGQQHYRRAASAPDEIEHAADTDQKESDNSAHPSHSRLYHPKTPYRCQSLPVVTDNEGLALQKSQTAAKRLEELRHALSAVVETDGISQVPVQDLLQATKLANQIGVVIGEHVSRRLTENK